MRAMYNTTGKDMMDERALILDAIKQKKKNTPDIDFDFPEPDVITKWAKRKKRLEGYKSKPIDDWTNMDFLHYLDYMLKEFGVIRARENTRRDSDKINQLHDRLVSQLSVEMNNSILREFMEWWCSIWAPRLSGSEFHLGFLTHEFQVTRFVSRYKKPDATEEAPIVSIESQVDMPSSIDDMSIYELGGINLLLMKRGIVIGYRILKKHGVNNVDQVIKKSIEQFNKEVLINVLNVTMQESPYPMSDKVNFISPAADALGRFGLTEYAQISHESYFKE
jgi:hypothetical protein